MWRFLVAFGGFILVEVIVSCLYLVPHQGAKPLLVPQPTARIYPAIIFNPQLPDIPEVFTDNHTWTATLSADHIRVMTVTGDIIPARSVNNGVMARNDPLWPYQKVAPVMSRKKSDVLFINLESPLLPDCQRTIAGMVFCGNVRNIEGLKYLHVDVAGIANNHIENYGMQGITSTENLLHSVGITPTATNGAVFKTIRGKRFAFLAYNDIGGRQDGVNEADTTKILQQVSDAKKQADIVVVQFHWGTEYQSQPDKRQIDLGHWAVDSGADVVIGNHPHWIQPIEFYHGKLITYAHGNFIFDQMWSQKTREGVVGYYTFYDNQLIDVEYMPLQIDDYGQPHFVDGVQKKAILDDMRLQSIIRVQG